MEQEKREQAMNNEYRTDGNKDASVSGDDGKRPIVNVYESLERLEREQQERQKADWKKFVCHDVGTEISLPITETDNYDGTFYTRMVCEIQAWSMLRRTYDETKSMIREERLYSETIREILDFAEERFGVETLRLNRDHEELSADKIKEYLNLEQFRKEVEDKLRKVHPRRLKCFSDYFRRIAYSYFDGDEEALFAKLNQAWNYSGYDAYLEIQHDARNIANEYAEAATKIAQSALGKRSAWIEAMKDVA